jgi:hypothetical protein
VQQNCGVPLIIKLIISVFLFTSFSQAALPIIGEVTKVRGKATALFIGQKKAIRIKKGLKIRKDTSVLTKLRSFVQIRLNDNSKISIGPNSKMMIDKVTTSKAGFITLLKGQLRSNVQKDTKNKEKLLIKTRTAALGVRGTDFRTSYNPESKITNLITFTGNVALKKIDEKKVEKPEDIVKELKKKDVIEVKKGKFSSVSNNLEKATVPVKISPVQYTRLKINTELKEKVDKVEKNLFKKEFKETIELYKEISKEEKKENLLAAREYSVKEKLFRPTSGGLIDFDSGIYVPPAVIKKDYDEDLNIYKIKPKKGDVTKSGDYIPPEGLKLDPTKGFIAADTSVEEEKVTELNDDIKAQLVKPKKPTLDDLDINVDDAYDKYFKIK